MKRSMIIREAEEGLCLAIVGGLEGGNRGQNVASEPRPIVSCCVRFELGGSYHDYIVVHQA